MGEIGWSKVFLTPRVGPRQRFAFIITDAPLDPDPLMAPGTLCDRCKLCVQGCPGHAISADESVRVTLAGNEVEWNALDVDRCSAVYSCGAPEYSPFVSDEVAGKLRQLIDLPPGPERDAVLASSGGPWGLALKEVPYNRNGWESYHHPGAICGARGCQRACFIHLEEEGKLENHFHHPFRLRKPWRLGQ
jgi:ferredoxin